MFTPNPITAFDFYKADHISQYPPGTDMVYSNFTPRSDRLARVIKDQWESKIVFAGLQALLIKFFIGEFTEKFFSLPKEEAVGAFVRRMKTSLGEGAVDSSHIAALHDLGYLPIVIKALPEGSHVPMQVPVMTIKNTLPEFYWLTNAFETVLSMYLWKPCTSATIAFEYRKLLEAYAAKTGTAIEFVDWQAHDFSMRGMSGFDDAMMSSFGHLLSFTGTDTIPAIDFVERFYGANADTELVAGSVPATEHSVMCMGMQDGEEETFRRLIEDTYPNGIVSIVSDTWDFWSVMTKIAPSLKEKILARDGKVVFRPDSGDPVKILCGERFTTVSSIKNAVQDIQRSVDVETPHAEPIAGERTEIFLIDGEYHEVTVTIDWSRYDKRFYYIEECILKSSRVVELTPEQKGAVQVLWEGFGGTLTSTGHKLLDSHIGLIYGDSITLDRAKEILEQLEAKGFASGNVVFGVGSYTYEYVTRDTFGFAMKATAGSVNGELREIFKDPVTDNGVKKSAKGLLRVELENGTYVLYDRQTPEQESAGELRVVFKDGNLVNFQSLKEIRAHIRK